MTRYWFVSEGGRGLGPFADFVRTFGCEDTTPAGFAAVRITSPQPRFLGLLRNSLSEADTTTFPLLLAHGLIDAAKINHLAPESRRLLRTINLDLIVAALEDHDAVIFGVPKGDAIVNDVQLIQDSRYLARSRAGSLIDLESRQEVVGAAGEGPLRHVSVTALFSVIRAGSTPFYYILLEPSLLRLSDETGFDFRVGNNVFHESGRDGMSIRSNIFTSSFSKNVTRIGRDSLLVDGDQFTFNLIDPKVNMFTNLGLEPPQLSFSAETSLRAVAEGNSVRVSMDGKKAGFIRVAIDAGRYIDGLGPEERYLFEYLVHALSG